MPDAQQLRLHVRRQQSFLLELKSEAMHEVGHGLAVFPRQALEGHVERKGFDAGPKDRRVNIYIVGPLLTGARKDRAPTHPNPRRHFPRSRFQFVTNVTFLKHPYAVAFALLENGVDGTHIRLRWNIDGIQNSVT